MEYIFFTLLMVFVICMIGGISCGIVGSLERNKDLDNRWIKICPLMVMVSPQNLSERGKRFRKYSNIFAYTGWGLLLVAFAIGLLFLKK
jgi:hypothetical protein